MTTGSARRHRRFSATMLVEISAHEWQDVMQLTTDNVSRGGLFIRADNPPAVGSSLSITLKLPNETSLKVGGKVVHAIDAETARARGQAPGFGVRFDEENTIDLNLLEAIAASNGGGRNTYRVDQVYVAFDASVRTREAPPQAAIAYQLIEHPGGRIESEPNGVEGAETAQSAEAPVIDRPPPVEAEAQPEPADVAAAPAAGPRPLKSKQPPIFGVDFGTTFSSVAVVDGEELRLLEDGDGNASFPSVVCYPEEGPPIVGWEARTRMATHPATTIGSPKRLLGRRYDDRAVEPFLGGMAVRTQAGPNGMIIADIYGEPVAMPQVSAEIFRQISRVCEEAIGSPAAKVVISAPVAYDKERSAIKRAAQLAGLEVAGMIDEPVAAAMSYGLGRQDELVAVYDFGGGTFDFTLIQIQGGRFKVLGEAGDAWLGGNDFDIAVAEHLADGFCKRYKVDLRKRAAEWQRLLFFSEAAKRKLSVEQSVEVKCPAMAMSIRGAIALEATIDRPLLDRLCMELVDRSIETVDGCLALAGVAPTDVGQVVMTGGVSRMALVRQRIQQYFQREIQLTVDPEHAVVVGNAIYARFLSLTGKAPPLG